MLTLRTDSERETEDAGAAIAKKLSTGDVVALFGPMGMGKTVFTRGLARGLGYTGDVSSPTFALVHEYEGGRLPLFHFDMYRIARPDDLYSTGFYEYLDRGGVLVIEWSENISGELESLSPIRVTLSAPEHMGHRKITVEGGGRF